MMQLVKRMTAVWCTVLFVALGAVGPFTAAAGENSSTVKPLAMGLFGEKPAVAKEEPKVDKPTVMIRLGAAHFDPLFKQPAAASGAPTINAFANGTTGYYVVQFDGPVKSQWKEALEGAGAEILDYVPDFAFMVRMNSDNEGAVRALEHVRWVGIFQPSYRVSQNARSMMYTQSGDPDAPPVLLRVNIFPGVNSADIEARIRALGGEIKETSRTKSTTSLKVEIPAKQISAISGMDGVKWIEPAPKWKLYNNVSTDVMNAQAARDTHGLYGSGQTVGVADTGLDIGSADPAALHDDFEDGAGNSRVVALLDTIGDMDTSDTNGHGTHVAGSVLGNGVLSGSNPTTNSFPTTCFAGVAPKANLVFQALMRNSDGALLTPLNLNTLFAAAKAAGANLHTNSWGSGVNNLYTTSSQDVDQFMWDNKDFFIQFAAGNYGIDMDADGVVDLYSIGAPATAKNCLTVGASEGDRPNQFGSWGGIKFPTAPILGDRAANNDRGLAAFSSRGPTLDGRHKPDLVAPGTYILSTRSAVGDVSQSWGEYADNSSYIWMGGTSMATPLAAGSAALMREYLMTQRGFNPPSAALIKAALLNSAEDISPGQYLVGPTQEIPDSPVPNNVQGWGRLNLGDGIFPAGMADIIYYDASPGVGTDGFIDHLVEVTDANAPLKINLVWTDYPGNPAAQGGLVNDLDLLVTAPGGAQLYADNASQKATVSTLSNDTGGIPEQLVGSSAYAVRFSPASHPVFVDSISLISYNNAPGTSYTVVVYDDNNGEPGAPLFSKTVPYIPNSASTLIPPNSPEIVTIPVETVVEISSGDFFVGVEVGDTDEQGLFVDSSNSGRSMYYDGANWVTETNRSYYIRTNVRSADAATSFDRVNNTLGLTIDTPGVGLYTIRVAGYNVPQGPQPFALVASGNIQERGTSVLQFSAATYSVNESGLTATINVIRTGGIDGAVSIEYATSSGTAAAGSDYTATSGTLDWLDGESGAKTFSVPVIDDTTTEADETVNLTLSNPTGGALLGDLAMAVLTIEDNEPGVVQFGANSYNFAENGGAATITVARSNGSSGAISVLCTTSDGTATAGSDYMATSQTISMADGVTSGTLNISLLDDGEEEPSETVTLTLSSPSGGATIGPLGTVTLTIRDNDGGSSGGGGGGCFIDSASN